MIPAALTRMSSRPKCVLDPGHRLLDRIRIGDVAQEGPGRAAAGHDGVDRLPGQRFDQVDDGDGASGLGQAQGTGPTHALGPPRHHGDAGLYRRGEA